MQASSWRKPEAWSIEGCQRGLEFFFLLGAGGVRVQGSGFTWRFTYFRALAQKDLGFRASGIKGLERPT